MSYRNQQQIATIKSVWRAARPVVKAIWLLVFVCMSATCMLLCFFVLVAQQTP
jgi:hypothetical protein